MGLPSSQNVNSIVEIDVSCNYADARRPVLSRTNFAQSNAGIAMKPLSLDLRQRIVFAYEAGEGSYEEIGRRFYVSNRVVGKQSANIGAPVPSPMLYTAEGESVD